MKTLLKPFQILRQGQQGLSIHGHQSKEIASTWRPISPITQIVLNKSSVGCNKQKRSQNFFLSVQALFCWAQCLHVLAQPTPNCETTVGWDKQSVPNVHPYFSKSRPFVSVVLLYDRPGPALLRHAD